MIDVDLFHFAGGLAAGLHYSFTATQLAVLGVLVCGLAVFWIAIIVGNVLDKRHP